jgi:hypothetical protein
MAILEQGIRTLIENEIISLIVFTFVFTIVFAVERKMHLFAKDPKKDEGKSLKNTKNVHTLIALVMAVLSVLPHYTMPGTKYDIVLWSTKFLPQVSLIVVTILGVLILLGVLGMKVAGGDKEGKNPLRLGFFLIILAIVIWLMFGIFGGIRLPNWLTPNIVAAVVALLVFGLVVSFIMRDSTDPTKKKGFQKNFDDFVKFQNK